MKHIEPTSGKHIPNNFCVYRGRVWAGHIYRRIKHFRSAVRACARCSHIPNTSSFLNQHLGDRR